eukprot:1038298-Heterocapsa_arctica.AAC.1
MVEEEKDGARISSDGTLLHEHGWETDTVFGSEVLLVEADRCDGAGAERRDGVRRIIIWQLRAADRSLSGS